jgi:hypothetical protein
VCIIIANGDLGNVENFKYLGTINKKIAITRKLEADRIWQMLKAV